MKNPLRPITFVPTLALGLAGFGLVVLTKSPLVMVLVLIGVFSFIGWSSVRDAKRYLRYVEGDRPPAASQSDIVAVREELEAMERRLSAEIRRTREPRARSAQA